MFADKRTAGFPFPFDFSRAVAIVVIDLVLNGCSQFMGDDRANVPLSGEVGSIR